MSTLPVFFVIFEDFLHYIAEQGSGEFLKEHQQIAPLIREYAALALTRRTINARAFQ
jgi:hypothetical protein